MLDVGIYPLSLATYLLGEIEDAKALAELGTTGVDEQTTFTLRHRSGGLSCICLFDQAESPTLTVSGSAGHLRLHAPFFHAQGLTIVDKDGASRSVQVPSIGNGYAHEAISLSLPASQFDRKPADAAGRNAGLDGLHGRDARAMRRPLVLPTMIWPVRAASTIVRQIVSKGLNRQPRFAPPQVLDKCRNGRPILSGFKNDRILPDGFI